MPKGGGGGGLDSSFRQPEKSQITAARLISWVAEGGGGEGVRWDPLATMLITAGNHLIYFAGCGSQGGEGGGSQAFGRPLNESKKNCPLSFPMPEAVMKSN